MATIQQARREMYRTQILAAAEQEFSEAGFAGAKMESIAATAGVSLATIYKTFDGKLDIWNGLHGERMDALLNSVDAATRAETSALDRLVGGLAAVARFLAEHDSYLNLNVHAASGWADDSGGAHGVAQTVWTAGLTMVAGGVAAAIADGEIPELRPQLAAGLLVSVLQVCLADWVRSGRDRDAETVIAEMEQRMRWLLAGPNP